MHKLVDKVNKESKTTATERLEKAKRHLLKAKRNKEMTDRKNNVARLIDPEEKRAEMDRALGRKPKPPGEPETKLKQALKDYDKLIADRTGATEFIAKLAITKQNLAKKIEKQKYAVPDPPSNSTAATNSTATQATNSTSAAANVTAAFGGPEELQKALVDARKQTERKLKRLQQERERRQREDARMQQIIKKNKIHNKELEK